jgi:hypothetical protein
MNRKETIIYLAGIVDGEGYVGIKKSKYARHCPSPTYHERIQIRMIDEGAIKLFQKIFGGNYYKEKPHCAKGNLLYCYQASDLLASKICKELLPYLLIKKSNAQRILKLRQSKNTIKTSERGGNRGGRQKGNGQLMSSNILAYREQLYLDCKRHRLVLFD